MKVLHLLKRLHMFARDRRGAIGVIFGLMLIPITEIAGVAIDYSNAARLNSRLKAAADAATLSAVRDIAMGVSTTTAYNKAQDVFKSDLYRTASLQNATISFNTVTQPKLYTTTGTYSAQVATYFAKIIGVPTVNLGGTSSASFKRPTYKNFFIVVDSSESMGLAATTADIAKMQANTPDTCALACHTTEIVGYQSNELYAKALGVTTRLDVVKQTLKNIFSYIQTNSASGFFRFGVYAMREKLTPLNPTRSLSTLSSDYSNLSLVVDNIGLTATMSGLYGMTYLRSSLASVLADIPTSGDGTTAATAENYVFILTDGVNDVSDGDTAYNKASVVVCPGSTHCTGPIDPTWCDAFKTANATVGVVYTTYLDVGIHYPTHVAPFASQIKPKLTSCASTGYFYEGTQGSDISNAMLTLFMQAIGNVRLSN